MAERTTLARPYAEAVFKLAEEASTVARWSDVLGFYAVAMQDRDLADVLGNPRVSPEQADKLLGSLLEDISGQEAALLTMLRENGKLQLMPEISALFNEKRDTAEGVIEASVVSAFELKDDQVKALAGMLKKELNRDVTIKASVDPSIIGGVVIRAGDIVIDGSVAGKLKDLTSYLTR